MAMAMVVYGITFFLVPNGSTPNITVGGSIGLSIGPSTYVAISPFVAVEFDTYQDTWDPVDITQTTHVGIDINSLNSRAYAIWNNDIIDGLENEAWISYSSSSQNLSVILRTGSVNNSNSAESSISFVVDLKTMFPEWVTIGFSTVTGLFFEKNNIKSWAFNSTLQSPNPSPSLSSNTVTHSPGKKIGKNNKKAQVVGLTISSFVLVVGLSLLSFVLWKKSSKAKQEDEFAIELSMDNDFEVAALPILLAKMLVPTYLAPLVNASSLVSLTYGSTTVSNSNQV
ncbi:L-type lectin-domain containing receptor kinase IX.1 [Camellia lanceoleosa]|uniref:L-type lectin-domain containing receptor kinase IX.1 n=1 Tax=Camellia lanceoleosa TaxID=1840588 RepID=A0ACC0FTX8_9ERIC|nr:L-type lectin-domain containing receptor kinase IX.1 [Camellia lanceoleosa]